MFNDVMLLETTAERSEGRLLTHNGMLANLLLCDQRG